MIASIANRELYVADGDKLRKKSTRAANAMAIELLNYGIVVDQTLVERISRHKKNSARTICADILKMYTIGHLNRPLFDNWEDRTEFTFSEIFVQIMGYRFQISGNDLDDPQYMIMLREKVDFKKMKQLALADDHVAKERFLKLVDSKVALDKPSQQALASLAKVYYHSAPEYIQSAEARIAVLLAMTSTGVELCEAMLRLKCQDADAMRYAAAKQDFELVKLPSDVIYAKLKWRERVQLLAFLMRGPFESLCESMGNHRTAWIRFFHHIHLFQQQDFRNRFTHVVAAGYLSIGSKQDAVPAGKVKRCLEEHSKFYDVTPTGNLAFRTFASRVQSNVDNKDFEGLKAEVANRPDYVFRNLGTLSNVCTKKTANEFVEMVRGLIDQASPGVLFSILQIDINADYRIIDSKGNTTVNEADYHPVIGEIQGLAEREVYRRFGKTGQVKVAEKLRSKIVPFLSTNAELDRGTRIKFEDANYLYFLMHWVQREGCRTDLDHSYVCLDAKWNAETIYFGNQANSFIKQSGDITNAPAPAGGTEYGCIDLKIIPDNVNYIVPIMNVYSGDAFSDNEVAYAGFMFSNEAKFSIKRKHVRYDLSQPAQSNIPFVIDVRSREILIVDFNNRSRNGLTAHASIGEIKKLISALETKKFMTIERFAKILSGDDASVSLSIKTKAKGKDEIEPADLHSLVST